MKQYSMKKINRGTDIRRGRSRKEQRDVTLNLFSGRFEKGQSTNHIHSESFLQKTNACPVLTNLFSAFLD